MGGTTNRQPVTFAIPKSPAYKFLNVTEFKGLNISDNPFIVGADSASDCLNVYVDESNALTTRPRIEKIFSMTGVKKVLHTYSLEKDTVFQVLNNDNEIKLYHYDGSSLKVIDTIRFNLKEDKYCVFEKDDVYYVAGNGIYASYTNDDLVLRKIEDAYVPVRYIGDVASEALKENEARNILTNKYRIAYSWDTKSNPSKIYENNGVLIDNEYHKTYESNNINYELFNHVLDMFETSKNEVFKIGNVQIGYSRENLQLKHVGTTLKNNHLECVFESDEAIFSERDLYGLISVEPFSGWIVEVINRKRIKVVLPVYYKSRPTYFIVGNYYESATHSIGSALTELRVSNYKIIENQKMLFGGDVLGVSPDGNVVAFSNKNRTGVAVINIATKEIRYLFYNTVSSEYDEYYEYSYHTNAKCVVSNDMNSVLIINTKTTEPGEQYENAETGEQFIDFYYDWQLTAYSYDAETKGYTKNVLYTNEKHTGLYSAFVELKYDAINDKALIYYPGGSGTLLYLNNLGESPVETVKKWTKLYGENVKLSFSSDLLMIYNISNGVLSVGVVSDSATVSDVVCNLNGLDVKQLALSDSNLFTFATDEAVYGYDVINNTYYKMYDLSKEPEDAYYSKINIVSRLLSKNNVLYRTISKWNDYVLPSYDRLAIVKWRSDSLEFTISDALIVEYNEKISDSNKTEEYTTSSYFDVVGEEVGKLFLDSFENIIGITVKLYNNEMILSHELVLLSDKLTETKTIGAPTTDGNYAYTYDKENNIFYLEALTEDIEGKKFEINVVYSRNYNKEESLNFNSLLRFQNNFWFYGDDNVIRWTDNDDPTYIPENNYKLLGDPKDVVTDMLLVSYDTALAFKKDTIYVINPITADGYSSYTFVEAKSQNGSEAPNSAIISPLKELPMFVNNTGIYGLQQLQNVQSTDRLAVLYSERMNPKFLMEQDITKMKTVRHLYWVLFMIPREKVTGIYVFDDRNNEWFYWELPIVAASIWKQEDVVYLCDIKGGIYAFKTTDIINKRNGDVEYYDDGNKPITWYWKSQILPLGTINYSKKLLETTFILSDTDSLDNYGINYTFKAYRKLASETNPTTISDSLNYVQSVTKRTMVHRFKFLQIEISNTQGEKRINDKFRLIGLGLKYTLLEGLR